jgi:hypothetical protein
MANQSASCQLLLLKAIKNICRIPQNLDMLEMCDAIEILCDLLWRPSTVFPLTQDHIIQIYSSLFYLLKLNVRRQDRAISQNVLLYLTDMRDDHALRQFTAPILCELVRNPKAIAQLWELHGLEVLLNLSKDICWTFTAFDALLFWLIC